MKTFDIDGPTPQGPADDAQQKFLCGISFHEAALRAAVVVNDDLGAPIDAVCPMIVCYAFAAELYLKSLIATERGSKAVLDHSLRNLFDKLSPAIKQNVAVAYEGMAGRPMQQLELDLDRFANAFKDWRYIYEGDGLQIYVNLLEAFVKATYTTICDRQSNWSVRAYWDKRFRAGASESIMTVKNLGGGTFVKVVDGTGGTLSAPNA